MELYIYGSSLFGMGNLNSLKKLNPLSAKYENISSCINKLAENIEIYSSITPS